jgi:hypothetical protein
MPPTNGTKVKLAGKQRTLRYTQPALEKLEDERNGEPLGVTIQQAGRLSAKAITALLWAGLQHEEPAPAIDDVRHLIVPPYRPIVDAVVEALTPWIEQPDEEPEGKAPAAG